MTRYSIAVACCMAASLVSQEVNAQEYAYKLERPSDHADGGIAATVTFVTERSYTEDECNHNTTFSSDAIPINISPVGAIKGYKADSSCARVEGINKFAKFNCDAGSSSFIYKEYYQVGCNFGTQNPDVLSPGECKADGDDMWSAAACVDVTSGDAEGVNMGSMFVTSTRYSGVNDCNDAKNPKGQEDMIAFRPENTGCQKLMKDDGTDTIYWYNNACPEVAGPLTTLHSGQPCNDDNTMTAGEINVAPGTDGELLKSVAASIIKVGSCDTNTFSNYDTCTVIGADTQVPTLNPTDSPTTMSPSKSPTITPPSKSPSKNPTDAPTTPSPTLTPSTSEPTVTPATRRPTNADSGATAQGVAGDVFLAVAVATLALGAMA